MDTNSIQKSITLKAARHKVWSALSDSSEFGAWFGMRFSAPFKPGARMQGIFTPTCADAEVAHMQKPYQGLPFEITIEQMSPETLFSFRWHPFALDPAVDYSQEPTTLIVFTLDDVAGGVLLTVTESGFDQIPLARRVQAFSANEHGWSKVIRLIENYLRDAA